MKKNAIVLIVALLFLLLYSCTSSDNTFYCDECSAEITMEQGEMELDEDSAANENIYTCKDCAYRQGYMDGNNAIYEKIEKVLEGSDGQLLTTKSVEDVIYKHFDNATADKILDEIYTKGYTDFNGIDYIDDKYDVPDK